MNFWQILLVIICFSILVLVMLQESKSSGASGALMGGGLNLFSKNKERGIVRFLSKFSMSLVVLLIIVAIIMRRIN